MSATFEVVLRYGGVIAFALLIMYMLFKRYNFSFSTVPGVFAGIIVIVIVVAATYLIGKAIDKGDAPKPPAQVSHEGDLQNLISLASKDPNAPITVKWSGSSEDQTLIGKLYFGGTKAPTYEALLAKLCSAKSQCIKCETAGNVVTISKIGNITPSCKKDDGSVAYCCT